MDRMAAQSAKIEAGHVYLPKSAAWLGEFLTELLSFPNGRHDDQVDSVSQFLRWLQDAYLNQISFHVPFVVSQAEGIFSSLATLELRDRMVAARMAVPFLQEVRIAKEVGPVDILVNNAGITRDTTFKKMSRATGIRSFAPISTRSST